MKSKILWASPFFLALLLIAGCTSEKPQAAARSPVPVAIATVAQQTVPVQIRAIGNVEAPSSVVVKTMVGGEIVELHFKEGQEVKKGDVLFVIDRRPFEAALSQAEANLGRDTAALKQARANLVRDEAQATNARTEAKRYEDLFKQGIVAREMYDQRQTTLDALDATVAADHAAIENSQASIRADQATIQNARVNLDYCTIRAPIDGRTGSLSAYQGTVVKANDTVLVTINQLRPIYVDFTVPQQYLGEVKKYLQSGRPTVSAVINNDSATPETGRLTFVDNSVDAATGTIKLKGTFVNDDHRLWPGQFVDVVMTLTSQPNAIVVPTAAVTNSQAGQMVYVIRPNNTVEARKVTVNRTYGDVSVIDNGLRPGERVVTDGQIRLTPDATVVESKSGTQGASTLPESQEARS